MTAPAAAGPAHPARLLDALTAIGADRARIALITPIGDGGQDDDARSAYRHPLMPTRAAG